MAIIIGKKNSVNLKAFFLFTPDKLMG